MSSSILLRSAALFAALAGSLLAQKPVLTEDFESGKIDPAVWDMRQKGGETIAVEPVEGAHGRSRPRQERGHVRIDGNA